MIGIGEVNFKTCSYVGRYCLKKHYKKNMVELNGALREFTLSSRNPGIGMLHYDDYLLSDSDYVTVVASDGSRTFPMPKCFIKKVEKMIILLTYVIIWPILNLSKAMQSCVPNLNGQMIPLMFI